MPRYAITPTSLGFLLVGASDRGVCAVSLAEDPAELQRFLAEQAPASDWVPDDEAIRPWSDAIVEHLEGKRNDLDVPLDVEATPFQERVWSELRKIPYGSTRSYRAIAEALGQPNAFRAVARACATNPVAIVVPCHRVIHSDGSLSGYRWGVERKRALLERESQTPFLR